MRLILLLLLFASLILHFSCKKYSPAEEAFFIRPGAITVATTEEQGSGSHKITDLWFYTNGMFQGAFPVGNMIPVVSKGQNTKISIWAGIKRNGIADTRMFTYFYSLVEFDTLVESGKIIDLPLTFRYSPAVTFTWTEDFEGPGYTIQKSKAYSDTTFKIAAASESFEGQSAELGLSLQTPTGTIAQIESSGDGFSLPQNSSDIFLELDYKCNESFLIGLIGDGGVMKSVININPHESWNKIYVHLSEVVATAPTSSKYKIYFALVKRTAETTPRLFLDNIKLIYLP
jgi:hypothetical protein